MTKTTVWCERDAEKKKKQALGGIVDECIASVLRFPHLLLSGLGRDRDEMGQAVKEGHRCFCSVGTKASQDEMNCVDPDVDGVNQGVHLA